MYKNFSVLFVFAVVLTFAGLAAGQTPASLKPTYLRGEVKSLDAAKMVLATDAGAVDVMLTDKTAYKRVPPENPVLSAAVAATASDIGVGDKVVVSGILSEDKRSMPARTVLLMTKGDIAQRAQKESERWRMRGISGKVAAVDIPTGKITIAVRTVAAESTVVLTPKPDAKFRRYAPNSVKFSEAVASSLNDLKVGDMLRAVGDKSPDGATFAAEEIVTGAFQTIAGTVKSVDAAKNEIVITNSQTKKDVTVDLSSASLIKRFPPEIAARMAQMQAGGGAGPRQGPPEGGSAPAGAGPGGGRGGFGARTGGIDDLLERFPTITVADLKINDVIAVSSTKNSNVDRITAINFVAGVEPFLRAAQAQPGGGRSGRAGADGGFTIPGLDGFGGP